MDDLSGIDLQLSRLQREHDLWCARNFGEPDLADYIFGAVEEVGEMAHHYLKMKQGIRGSQEYHKEELLDSVADCVIFMASIPTILGEDYGKLVDRTWKRVKQRDWVADPQRGGE